MVRITRFALGHGAVTSAPRVGALLEAEGVIVDLAAALGLDGSVAGDTRAFLERGDAGTVLAIAAIAAGTHRVPLGLVRLLAPIANPGKILCVGMNYEDHCLEQGMPLPDEPVIFCKFANAVLDPGAPIPLIPECKNLDFEVRCAPSSASTRLPRLPRRAPLDVRRAAAHGGLLAPKAHAHSSHCSPPPTLRQVELAIVIGKPCYRISEEDALSYVAGLTTAHDVSARNWQINRNSGQWFLGKAFDGFAPMGPAIVSTDELGGTSGIKNLAVKCFLNGEVVQDSTTAQMVHGVEACVAWISTFMTLLPGDVIFTGTPPGVGCFRKPQLWLKDGDEVTVEIEGIGAVTNRVQAVPETYRGKSKLLARL